MIQMIVHERCDKVVTVIVAGLHSQGQWLASSITGSLEQARLELFVEEFVAVSLVNEDLPAAVSLLHQGCGIMLLPS